jgi:ABC-type phosphate transport system substrate-binding protein
MRYFSAVVGLIATLATCTLSTFVPNARASERMSLYWQSNQCWQTGGLGNSLFACENADEPGYLGAHMIQDPERSRDFTQPSGQYCSYYGVPDEVNKTEPTWRFAAPAPSGPYQEGDGRGNVCAVWANPGEPIEWGVGVTSETPSCVGPEKLCGMQNYFSLASQDDRPWSTDFRNPTLALTASVSSVIMRPNERGQAAGYLCPILKEVISGDIIEACFEEWLGYGAHAEGGNWEFQHVVECRPKTLGFPHTVDKIIEPAEGTARLVNVLGEPIEVLTERFAISAGIGGSGLSAIASLDDTPSSTKTLAGRASEPELGSGCSRTLSTDPADWALIGIADGVEEFGGARVAAATLGSPFARTTYELLPIEVSATSATPTSETAATVTADIDPYGYETDYVVEYFAEGSTVVTTAPTLVGSGTNPVPITAPLAGLSPHTGYTYRVKAFHPELGEAVYSGWRGFVTPPEGCTGSNVTGSGDPLLEPTWAAAFHTQSGAGACNGSQGSKGTPSVSFATTSGRTALESWGAHGHGATYTSSNAFLGSEEPPSPAVKEEIEAHETSLQPQTVETVPVAQSALAVIVHLPSNCVANSKKDKGRLELNNVTLEGIFRGTITKWSQITDDGDTLSGSGCNAATVITPVVRRDIAGTTHVLKKYLDLIFESSIAVETGGPYTWSTLSEGTLSTDWPSAAKVVKPPTAGEAGVLSTVAGTPGSIGYANLADTRAYGAFTPSPGTGGPGASRFWAPIQNDGISTSKVKYADPSTNKDEAAMAESNCANTEYANGLVAFPPANVAQTWNEVGTQTSEKEYPMCDLVYDVALARYSIFSGATLNEATTVQEYLSFVTGSKAGQGQKLIASDDYEPLPKGNVLKEAQEGAQAVGF